MKRRIKCAWVIEKTVGSIPWGATSLCLTAAIFTPRLDNYIRRTLTRESGTDCAVSLKLRKGRFWGEYLRLV